MMSATTGKTITITAGGPRGPSGGNIVMRGVYAAGTTYQKDDGVVSAEGRGFYALQETTGNAPPSYPTVSNAYWCLFAEKGLGDIRSDGTVKMSAALESEVATGNPPFVVASSTKVSNLDVDSVDGEHLPTSGVGNAGKVMRVSSGGALELADSLALAGSLSVVSEKTDHQMGLDIARGIGTVAGIGALGGTWTVSEGASDNTQIVTRTAAAADHYYRIPIPLPKRNAASKGAKLKSVTVSYVAGGTLDTTNDAIQALIIKQVVPANGSAASASILAGDDNADYDTDHDTNAERVEAGAQTMTVTIPTGEQAYAAENVTYALRIRVKDAATANLTFVLTGAVASYAAAEY